MSSMVNKFRTKSQTKDYSQEIFDLYANSVGELNVTDAEESFVKDLISNCVAFFSSKEIFETLKTLKNKNLLTDTILKNSRVYTVNRSSRIDMREAVKGEVEELTCNSLTKHLKGSGEIISSYQTTCFTIPSLKSKIIIGDNETNITYKKNGSGIYLQVVKSDKSSVDFGINNLIILHKKEMDANEFKEFVNVIIVPKLDFTSTDKTQVVM